MNITEDRFSNKLANDIYNELLLQHKNNTSDALEYAKNVLKKDGLISQKTKQELEKATDMLTQRLKTEAIWPFKSKSVQTCDARFEIYLPFKKEPVVAELKSITGLDDPRIEKVYAFLRKKHPKSPIRMYSDFGNKTFYENTIKDYRIIAKNANGLVDEYHAGNLPIAKGILKKLSESEDYDIIEISDKQGTVVDCYDRKCLKDGIISDFATNTLSAVTGIYPGIVGPALQSVTDTIKSKYDLEKKYLKQKEKLKAKYNKNTDKKEANELPGDVEKTSYINKYKDVYNFEERKALIRNGIHPDMKRKTKFEIPMEYFTPSDQRKIQTEDSYRTKENSFYKNHEYTYDTAEDKQTRFVIYGISKDGDKIYLAPRIPHEDKISKNGNVTTSYRKGGIITQNKQATMKPQENIYMVSTEDFAKAIIESEINQELFSKFAETHPELNDMEAFLAYNKIAEELIDERFEDWEKEYKDKYHLYVLNLPEKSKLYDEWNKHQLANPSSNANILSEDYVLEKHILPKVEQVVKNLDKALAVKIEDTKKTKSREYFSKNVLLPITKSILKDTLTTENNVDEIFEKIASELNNSLNDKKSEIKTAGFETLLNSEFKNLLKTLENHYIVNLSDEEKRNYETDKRNVIQKGYFPKYDVYLLTPANREEIKKALYELYSKYKTNKNVEKTSAKEISFDSEFKPHDNHRKIKTGGAYFINSTLAPTLSDPLVVKLRDYTDPNTKFLREEMEKFHFFVNNINRKEQNQKLKADLQKECEAWFNENKEKIEYLLKAFKDKYEGGEVNEEKRLEVVYDLTMAIKNERKKISDEFKPSNKISDIQHDKILNPIQKQIQNTEQ